MTPLALSLCAVLTLSRRCLHWDPPIGCVKVRLREKERERERKREREREREREKEREREREREERKRERRERETERKREKREKQRKRRKERRRKNEERADRHMSLSTIARMGPFVNRVRGTRSLRHTHKPEGQWNRSAEMMMITLKESDTPFSEQHAASAVTLSNAELLFHNIIPSTNSVSTEQSRIWCGDLAQQISDHAFSSTGKLKRM